MYLSVCLSVSSFLTLPSFSCSLCLSAHISLTVTVSICDSLAPSIFLFLPLPVYLYLPLLIPPLLYPCFVAHSPTQFFHRLACVCLFPSIPRSASCLLLMPFVCGSPSLYKTLTLLSAFPPPPLSPSICIPLSDSPSPSPSVSPDIHVEIFSHVRYRFMTPVRSPWPLNLIPSTKPHCFFVCLDLSVVCNCG